MSRLSQLAVSKRSVTLLLAFALFIAGISAWGSLKQELLPDIEFPVITVIAPYPGAGSSDVAEQVAKPIEQVIAGDPAARDRPVDLGELDRARHRPVLVRHERQGGHGGDPGEHRQGGPPGDRRPRTSRRSTSTPRRSSSRRSRPRARTASSTAADIARTEIVPEIQAIEGVASADVTGGLEQRLVVTLDPDKLAAAGVSVAAGRRDPPGEQPDVPVRPALRRRDEDPGLDDRDASLASTRSRTWSSATQRPRPRPVQPAVDPLRRARSQPAAPDPDHDRRPRDVELPSVATTGYAPDQRQSVAQPCRVTKTSDANTVAVADGRRGEARRDRRRATPTS